MTNGKMLFSSAEVQLIVEVVTATLTSENQLNR
uniref:Uncharacterized protein n=1 Tax=Arundo donax TaxID=35708 RepID=A0A0A9GVF2_ARUDO